MDGGGGDDNSDDDGDGGDDGEWDKLNWVNKEIGVNGMPGVHLLHGVNRMTWVNWNCDELG